MLLQLSEWICDAHIQEYPRHSSVFDPHSPTALRGLHESVWHMFVPAFVQGIGFGVRSGLFGFEVRSRLFGFGVRSGLFGFGVRSGLFGFGVRSGFLE